MNRLQDLFPQIDLTSLPSAEAKRLIRKECLERRAKIAKAQGTARWGPLQVTQTLNALGLDAKSSKYVVAAYFPIRGEPSLSDRAAANWIFPLCGPNNSLRWFYHRPANALEKNKFGIPEHTLSESFDISAVKLPILMFVPCVVVAKNGFRIGYGGGYYDRFLHSHGSRIATVCCTANELLFEEIPSEPFDCPVDAVATEDSFFPVSSLDQLLCKLRT